MFVIIERVMSFLMSVGPKIIKFPDTTDPGVLGCIDGSYIPIRTPARKVKSTYINRHDQTSLTLQGICDDKKRFHDAFTGTSSKMHDATVFQKSFVRDKIMNLGNRYHIIGDAAYPISENLLTPYRDYGNMTPIQENYNYKFSKTRVLIENSFGLLKGRFRQLMKTEFWGVEKTSKFVLCCCIVHNLCIDNGDLIDEIVDNQDPPDVPLYTEELGILRKQLGEVKRNNIARELME
nr:unnamed protein product [Callosobruchus analis]